MRQEIRINFTGQTTLDNGITVGVLVGLNGENVAKSGSTTQVNRAYADFSGKFGLVRVGEANSALVTDCVVDPGNVTSNFGVNSPNESFSDVGFAQSRNQTTGTANVANSPGGYFSTFGVAPMGSIGTCFGIEGKGNKIMYFSPSFGGLTFGVSFTPTGGQRRAGGGLSYGTDVTAPGPGNAGNNILSVGVDYTHDFGGWNLTAGGGGEWAFTQYTPAGGNANNKPAWYQAGVQIGIGHFAFGASGAYYQNYAHAGYASTTASSEDDGWVVSGGASYTIDAWSFGLQGEYGSYQQSASAILGTSAAGISADNEKMWGISFNTAYALGPGISLEGQVAYTQANYGSLSGSASPTWRFRRPLASMPQGPFLGNRPGYRDQLLIVGKTTTTSGERFAAPPFSFGELGVSAGLGAHRCRAATARLGRKSVIGPALDASGNSRNYRLSFRSVPRSET